MDTSCYRPVVRAEHVGSTGDCMDGLARREVPEAVAIPGEVCYQFMLDLVVQSETQFFCHLRRGWGREKYLSMSTMRKDDRGDQESEEAHQADGRIKRGLRNQEAPDAAHGQE